MSATREQGLVDQLVSSAVLSSRVLQVGELLRDARTSLAAARTLLDWLEHGVIRGGGQFPHVEGTDKLIGAVEDSFRNLDHCLIDDTLDRLRELEFALDGAFGSARESLREALGES